jgi:hypothetical protein
MAARSRANIAACGASSSAKRRAAKAEYVFMHLVCGMGHYEAAARIGRAAETCWRYRREMSLDPGPLVMGLLPYLGAAGAWARARVIVEQGWPATEGEALAS